MKHEEITRRIIKVFYDVYNELGRGFLESVYEQAMAIALREGGLAVTQQAPITVHFRGHLVGDFRADLLVEGAVIVELKAARAIDVAHQAQLMNYLRATEIEVGLLLNFGPKPRVQTVHLRQGKENKGHGSPRMNTDQETARDVSAVSRGGGACSSWFLLLIRVDPC